MDEIEFHGTITINDSIKGNGNFLLCDLICRYLKKLPTHRVCLIGSTRPQEHYVALGRKLGFNLKEAVRIGSFVYIDGIGEQDVVEKIRQIGPSFALAFDSLDVMEMHSDFLTVMRCFRVCRRLALAASVPVFVQCHKDIGNVQDETTLVSQLNSISRVVLDVKPLKSGPAAEIHGTITIYHREFTCHGNIPVKHLQYKLMENGYRCFTK